MIPEWLEQRRQEADCDRLGLHLVPCERCRAENVFRPETAPLERCLDPTCNAALQSTGRPL